ncbi:MAG: tetratricopeptide repeat protein [Microcoleus sp. PH2017_40_RAT_O_B]|uniref:tetratricopeptide repeat protein n=1 Tax=unclassified Microcoleus TaxID=2642155 RepID=UPI001D6FEBDA|nr:MULTISPECIES: tetratricopeptide repeat protein [unclassified Microcoleus]MCC3574616.1 tetratricopeptide repeat protein [Microcoleus sp. PH2017_34_RAT_O_A]MCC3612274.1 tetratricopeptide repeat protein [Microcoleus sp. PH2017_40_RAT_O_B]
MLDKIWRFLKQLIQRLFGTNPNIEPTPPQPAPTLTDAEYEAKLMELLEGVNQGWGRGDVAGFLIAKQIKNGDLAAWLRRFGDRSLEGAQGSTASADAVVSLQELARRLELLGGVAGGELGEAAGNVGREILVEFPLASVEGDEVVDREAEAWKKRGNEQYEQGNFQEALAFYERSIELKYNAPEVWEKRGLVLQKLGNYQGAIDSNNAASTLYRSSGNYESTSVPPSTEGFFNLSDIFDKALEIKPDIHAAWFILAYEQYNLGNFEEALASYDKALEFKPGNFEAWNNRGSVLDYLGRLEEAIASYDKALEFKPDDDVAWFNRGYVLSKLGRLEEAITSYDKALELKPNNFEAWNNRGSVLDDLGRLEEAIASYDKALKFKPDDDVAWNNRGLALSKLGRLEEGITSYDKALEFKPDDDEAYNNRGSALYNLGRLQEAISSRGNASY